MREQDCIGYTVRYMVFSSERIGQGMYCGCPAGCDGDASVISSEHHAALRLEIFRILIGSADAAKDELCPCKGKGIAQHRRFF